jgi:Uma2 family endonuclease
MPIPAPRPTELSVDAWIALDEDVEGELVDGRLVEDEVASWEHEIAVSWLISILRPWALARRGFVLGSETKLAISATRGRKPDALVYLGTRLRSGLPSPDIVIEVITATPRDRQRDRVTKKHDYATLGVGQYWLVDPEARTFEILALQADGRFLEVLAAAEGSHAVPGCDGLRLDLDALWAEIDQGVTFFAPLEHTDSDA